MSLLSVYILVFTFWYQLCITQRTNIGLNEKCNRFYDKPIGVCYSAYSSLTGLRSHRYDCYTNSTSNEYYIAFNTYNNTDDCSSSSLANSTILYNLTNSTAHQHISCNGRKPCPYFMGRYYITKLFTSSPTTDPTTDPTAAPTASPTDHPTTTNGTHAPSLDPSQSPTLEPTTGEPTLEPTINLTLDFTFSPSMDPTMSPIDLFPYLENETCAKTQLNDYYQDFVYIIDTCIPYIYNRSTDMNGTSIYNANITEIITSDNYTAYIAKRCNTDRFGKPLSISSRLFLS